MKVDRFDFDLPSESVAQSPIVPRDHSRLLAIGDTVSDHHFFDLPELLHPDDVLVFNDTRVIPARLLGKRGNAKVEVTLHKRINTQCWEVFAKPARKLKPGDQFYVSEALHAEVIKKDKIGIVTLKFNISGDAFDHALAQYGIMPLPPYIRRNEPNHGDIDNYQTIYAKHPGAVAAPTAGLHFTQELLNHLTQKGFKTTHITLHVGAGTFIPVKADDTKDHVMHYEYYDINDSAKQCINKAKEAGKRIVAIGTTSLRTLETAANEKGLVRSQSGETNLFITPGYRFKCVDVLITNFHLPRSTLFMLVCAFAGEKRMHQAYKHAIDSNYRFYSYGDACLIHKKHD